ncbi:MAG: hypothetical protein Q9166_006895 [cf. Caloplaca sp. 2 TL-2023]
MEDDEVEANEVELQRNSTKVIQELKASIPLFLYRNQGNGRIRRCVKQSSTAKIERLMSTFQEWPQLLDPAIEQLVRPLVTALAEYMQHHPHSYHKSIVHAVKLVDPLPRAICKLLYTLCKVRGSKVTTRFFINGPGLLEPMLDAFESWNGISYSVEDGKSSKAEHLVWEERYVMLLWLSHLVLTPFDLSSISTSASDLRLLLPANFKAPSGLPDVAHRLLTLSLHHLSSASKEQEAAVLLLVRLSLRPDMQRLALHQCSMDWAFSFFLNREGVNEHPLVYMYTGILSFMAGFFRSSDSETVAPFLVSTFQRIQDVDPNRIGIQSSAVTRKLIIKIHRSLAMHLLSSSSSSAISQIDDPDLLNSIFDHLLTSLGDKDNPVRLTASKALSVVAQQLDIQMTAQLVEEIAEKLQENTVFEDLDQAETDTHLPAADTKAVQRNLSAVDPLHWHGLILTLSHLLYRHSAPQEQLPTIMDLLINALDFEQRSPMGTSMGNNVRDAACFGIWSLARKYTTRELLVIPVSSVHSTAGHYTHKSVIEVLAMELVRTACLDPEGNIRRGASAALQELVGRHPDIVPSGIRSIQIVDYQAVGLRTRAMEAVLIQAATLDKIYLRTLSAGLLSWRAMRSPMAAVRRDAAAVIGQIVRLHGPDPMFLSLFRRFNMSNTSMRGGQGNEGGITVDEWHGIYLAVAALIREGCFEDSSLLRCVHSPLGDVFLLEEHGIFGKQHVTARGKGGELAIEALCSVIAAVSFRSRHDIKIEEVGYHIGILEACIRACKGEKSLELVKDAALSVVKKLNEQGQMSLVHGWLVDIQKGRNGQLRSGGSNINLITVLGPVLGNGLSRPSPVPRDLSALQVDVLASQLDNESLTGSKCAALTHLFMPVFSNCGDRPGFREHLMNPLIDCLKDYTLDARGDIGSDVRVAATKNIGKIKMASQWDYSFNNEAFGIVYGLAVEKLDKVRSDAWHCIRQHPNILVNEPVALLDTEQMASWSTYNVEYFVYIMTLAKRDRLVAPMIRGLITSASVGSEVLVRSSRMAILRYLVNCSPDGAHMFCEPLVDIITTEVPNGRLLRPGLEVLSFLLDVGPGSYQERATSSQWQSMLRDLARVHSSQDLPTLQAVIGVYGSLVKALQKVDIPKNKALTDSLSVLGMAGLTAYFDILSFGQIKVGDLGVVLGAAGATSSVLGRIAKLKGRIYTIESSSRHLSAHIQEL